MSMFLLLRPCAFLSPAFFCLLLSCGQQQSAPVAPPMDSAQVVQDRQWNNNKIDSAVSILQSGNIVLRSGRGPDSYLLSNLNQKDKTYSHCGIVMIEGGYPFVYHSIGGEDNPDERMRRDSARTFFSQRYNSGIAIVQYDLDAEHINRLGEVAREYYALRPLFDMQFDLATDNKLYCAEFVYKALNKAMGDTAYIKTSFAMGRRYVGVDDLFLNSHCRIIWKVAYK